MDQDVAQQLPQLRNQARWLARDNRGAVLIEAAIALPLLIVLLLGIISYAGYFMAAHSLQQAANEAARAAIAGVDDTERSQIVDASLAGGVLAGGTLKSDLVTAAKSRSGVYYTVTLTYPIARSGLYRTSLVPLPNTDIRRAAVVQLSTM